MSGYCMEIYSVDLKEAHTEVKKNMKQIIRRLCERKVLRAYDKVNNLGQSGGKPRLFNSRDESL